MQLQRETESVRIPFKGATLELSTTCRAIPPTDIPIQSAYAKFSKDDSAELEFGDRASILEGGSMFLVDVLTSLSVNYKGFKGTYENLEYEGWMPTPNHQNEEWMIRERLHDWYGVALSKDKKTLALSMTMGDGGVRGQFVMILASQKATLYRFESGDIRQNLQSWADESLTDYLKSAPR